MFRRGRPDLDTTIGSGSALLTSCVVHVCQSRVKRAPIRRSIFSQYFLASMTCIDSCSNEDTSTTVSYHVATSPYKSGLAAEYKTIYKLHLHNKGVISGTSTLNRLCKHKYPSKCNARTLNSVQDFTSLVTGLSSFRKHITHVGWEGSRRRESRKWEAKRRKTVSNESRI